MKRCPSCNRTYTDLSLNFCLEDGTPLSADTPPDPHATVRYPGPRDTSDPPPTEIYNPPTPVMNQVPELAQRQRAPGQVGAPIYPPQAAARKKSNAIWWILGSVLVLGIIGIGFIVMLLALASMSTNANENAGETNANRRVAVNRNANTNSEDRPSANSNRNTPTAGLPASFTDDFSEQKWGTGSSRYGDIWYADGEYHMRSKEKTFLVMYAPSNDYNTENATVRVTARSVDGSASTSGYGLVVHGEKNSNNELEDYALLIFTGSEPQFEVVSHNGGSQTAIVPWTKSNVIRSGTSPNQLEVRIKGTDLSFYANGQYLTRINDSHSYKRGLAGLYTSDTTEVAFDDLEIQR